MDVCVPGFRVAEVLRASDPASFALLCDTPIPFRHADPRHRLEAHHRYVPPVDCCCM